MKKLTLKYARKMWNNTWRQRRYAAAVFRYPSLYRLWNLAVIEMEKHFKKEVLGGLPYIFVIDSTNICNLKCPVCQTATGELAHPKGNMSLDQFKSLVDQIAPHTFEIILYNWGEPFLHKDILSMIRHAHEKRISVAVSSNLNSLPKGGADELVSSGLDDLIVSCDGLTQETYEQYRVNGSLAKVVDNLDKIRLAKQKLNRSNPLIEFQFLVFRHNEHEVPKVRNFAKHLGADHVRLCSPYLDIRSEKIRAAKDEEFVRPVYRSAIEQSNKVKENNTSEIKIMSEENHRTRMEGFEDDQRLSPVKCFWPWRAFVVNWNGQVDPCCSNNQLDSFGNVFQQPVRDIWNNSSYQYARRRITGLAKIAEHKNIICRRCSGYE